LAHDGPGSTWTESASEGPWHAGVGAAILDRMPDDPRSGETARPQVLVGEMPTLLADLVRQALADVDVDVVETAAAFRPASAATRPPVAIVASSEEAGESNREWLLARPETVILGVERHGRRLGASVLWPRREDLGELTSDSLLAAIVAAPSWRERFG
jgi:hypothetical protein